MPAGIKILTSGIKRSFLRRIQAILLFMLILQPVLPHYKARYHVIVDTDGGIDDFRAICMMLASPHIEIIAITAVDGVMPPDVTASRVRSQLQQFGHQGIMVGLGKAIPDKPGNIIAGSGMAGKISWGTESTPGPNGSPPDAVSLILESVKLEDMPVDIVALGPLTNLAGALKVDPGISGRVRQVYWLGTETDKESFNYALDPGSTQSVLASGFSISRVNADNSILGRLEDFISGLGILSSRYADAVKELYSSAPADFSHHYMATHLGDDCIPLYMLYPEYFKIKYTSEEPERCIARANPTVNHAGLILEILDSDQEDKSIIFSRFPTDPVLFEEDVADITPELIEKHGLREWKIVVLTNEFHEHLGIYSILGAKMGLRAREYFHVGIDELSILSCAGSRPQLSCLNDGLQVSTGATLGHGTIRLGEQEILPRAYFTFKNRVIRVTVRAEIRQKISEDVSMGVKSYGLDSPDYWNYIRDLALKYWLELSRYDIFEIEELPPGVEPTLNPALNGCIPENAGS